ncbi:RNA polymerase sigma factor [Winogradskyella aurantiaca]|uniref:RNA polymerase sigma factor n=1 Tax=Winogradskyella aurantiaca TaxID=2219558 RepID=UPI000E1D93F0|nr:RNA polymerase sigma factor [Winogradskyella aurantiaca]
MTTNEEALLVASILKGNTADYAKLVDQYKDLVYTLAIRMLKNREEAEEVSQDVFIKIFKSLASFKGDSKLSTWVYRVTYNCCLDQIKKNKKHLNDVPVDAYNYNKIDTIDNALEGLIKEEKQQLIRSCVNRLPEESSAIITLFYFDELSLDEISGITGIESNTVKVKLFRARKKLAKIMEQYMIPKNNLNYGT